MIERLEKLTAATRGLANEVGSLSLSLEQVERRTTRSERVTAGVVLGLLLSLVLTFAVAVVLVQQWRTNERLEGAIQRETQTRQEVLCPLYGLLVGSYNPDARPPGPARDQYLRMMQILIESYPKLNCANQIAPGATAVQPR